MHVNKDVWSSYIREGRYYHCDKRSAEELFGSGTASKQNHNVYSLEVLVKRHRLTNNKTHDAETCSYD